MAKLITADAALLRAEQALEDIAKGRASVAPVTAAKVLSELRTSRILLVGDLLGTYPRELRQRAQARFKKGFAVHELTPAQLDSLIESVTTREKA